MLRFFSKSSISKLFLLCSFTGLAQASPISITEVSFNSVAFNQGIAGGLASDGTQLPTDTVLNATFGGTSSETEVTWQQSGNAMSLMLGFEHLAAVGFDKRAYSNGYVRFTALQDSTYNLAGFYSSALAVQEMRMQVNLSEVATSSFPFGTSVVADLFRHREFYPQSAIAMGSIPSLTLGLGTLSTDTLDPFFNNEVTGALSGNLVAGTDYVFGFTYELANPGACATVGCVNFAAYPPGVAANGSTLLNITAASVPEPSTSLMLLLGLLGLLGLARNDRNINSRRCNS